ncbi:MAG: hypothetical protein ACI8TP_000146 [Acidimicrobiales bacterium]|jgi:uncharacterized protein (DUF1015 family)
MTTFVPLALRLVDTDWADRVPSPAHDALSPDQRRTFLKANPDSYLTVTRSPEDVAPGEKTRSADEVLSEGRVALDRLIDRATFGIEHPPRFYAYRLRLSNPDRGNHQQTGIVGGIALTDYTSGELRVHEQVEADRTLHLARHLGVVGAQSSPLAVAHRPLASIDALLSRVTVTEPAVVAVGGDGLEQTVWAITEPTDNETISAALANSPTYIVDGHHRTAAGQTYHAATKTQKSGLILVALFSTDLLLNRAFHRVIKGQSLSALREAVGSRLRWRECSFEDVEGRDHDEVALYGDRQWALLQLPFSADAPSNAVAPSSADAPSRATDPALALANLDPVRLDEQLLRPILGIDATDAGRRISYRAGTADLRVLAKGLRSRESVLCVNRAVPIDLLLDAADAGLVMPPKSTYFEPKVRSGVFVRSITD